MDTREKIVRPESLPALLEKETWVIVVGFFDPLTVAQAKRISAVAAAGSKTLALVLSGPDMLLPAEARAMLVAGLRDVDAVAISDDSDWRRFIPEAAHVSILEDQTAEQARSAEFVAFVIERQRSAEAAAGRNS